VRSMTEVVPSALPFTEVVPKNVAPVGADRSEQPQSASRDNSNDGESASRKIVA